MASVTSTSGSFKVSLLDSQNAEPKTTKAELTGPCGKIWHIELLQGATAGDLDQTKLESIAELFNEIFTGSSAEHTELRKALMALPNGNHLDIQEHLSDTTTSSSAPPTEGVCPRKTIQWPRGNGGPNANIGNQQNIMAIWEKLFPSRLEDAGMCSYNCPDVPTHTPQLKKPEPNNFRTPKDYNEQQLTEELEAYFTEEDIPREGQQQEPLQYRQSISPQREKDDELIEGTGPIKQLPPLLAGVSTPLETKDLLSPEEFRRQGSERFRNAAEEKKRLEFTAPSAQQRNTVSSFRSFPTSVMGNGQTARLAPPSPTQLTPDPITSGVQRELGDALAKAQALSAAWDGSHVGNPQSKVWQTIDCGTTQQTPTPSHLMPSPAISSVDAYPAAAPLEGIGLLPAQIDTHGPAFVEQAPIQPADTSVELTDRFPIQAQDDMGGVEELEPPLPNVHSLDTPEEGAESQIGETRVSSASTEFGEEETTGSESNRNSQEADEQSWSSWTPVALGGLAGLLITGNPAGAIIGAAIASTLRG